MSRPVTVYAEMTPNPATIKFVADVMLIDNGESTAAVEEDVFDELFELFLEPQLARACR